MYEDLLSPHVAPDDNYSIFGPHLLTHPQACYDEAMPWNVSLTSLLAWKSSLSLGKRSASQRICLQPPSSEEQPTLPLTLPILESPFLPEYIQAEAFLEVSGFFTPSSKRIRRIYTKEKKLREYTDEQGKQRTLKVEISANHKLGLPITSDLDYYRAFLKICDEVVDSDGAFKSLLLSQQKKLVRYAGKKWNPKTRHEIDEFLIAWPARF